MRCTAEVFPPSALLPRRNCNTIFSGFAKLPPPAFLTVVRELCGPQAGGAPDDRKVEMYSPLLAWQSIDHGVQTITWPQKEQGSDAMNPDHRANLLLQQRLRDVGAVRPPRGTGKHSQSISSVCARSYPLR